MGKQSLGRVLASTTCIIALMLACSSTHESEDVGVAREALSGTGGSKATGGTKSTGGKSGTGGTRTGGTSSTGGSKATGGKSGTGGSKATGGKSSTGGSKATGGKAATGGSKSAGGAHTGGKASTGGTRATGGTSATGGAATGGTTSLVCIPADCNDNNSCTTDSCVAGVCGHIPLANGTTCSDGNACTALDQCQLGACQAGPGEAVDDGDQCTTDSCDPITGVKHVPVMTDPKCAMWNSGALKVEVRTNYCDLQKVQQYFQVTNTGSSAVNLSDVTIKYWVDDTTGGHIVSDIYYGGCVVASPSNLTCLHTVTAVAATGTSITACASDPTHQANWEVAVGTTDSTTLQPGQQWNNIQTVVHLDTWASFVPGTSQWYSTCLTNPGFVADPHFAVFYKGNLVYSSGINAPDCAAPHGSQRLSGYMVPPVSTAPIVGLVPPTTVVTLPFGVPSQNLAGLQQLAQQVSDPTNPKYRAYVQPQDFPGLYGGLPGNYSGLSGILAGKGLTLVETYPNNLLMTISGTAAAFGQALYANLVYRQRPDGSQFISVDRDPSLDSQYPVSWISGLDEFQVPRGSWGTGPLQQNCSPGTSGISCNLYWGSDYRNAYVAADDSGNCPSADTLKGTDQYLGIMGYLDYVDDDINYFKGPNGIQLQRDVPVTRVIRGQRPPYDFGFDPGTRETDLDIEAALSIAPDLKGVYVFESAGNWAAIFHAAATTEPLANQVSSSWQFQADLNVRVALLQMAAQGQSYFQASGDDFKSPAQNTLSPYDIREADWVTVVGGTELTLNPTLTGYGSEVPWNGSVGGYAPDTPILPPYQSGMDTQLALAGGSTTHRNFPDVAMVATHGAVYYNGAWASFDGTSLSTPLWAGFMALVNEQAARNSHGPVGFANPGIYQLAKDTTQNQPLFHDGQPPPGQTTSSLGSQGLYNNAIGGFDLVTGWGSPTCALITALANTSQSPLTCPSGQSLCWGGCADVQTDPHNCGVCGFDCGAGQRTDVGNLCLSGVCQPFTVKAKTGVSRIAVDPNYVYVSTLPSSYGTADGALWSTTQEGLMAWNLVASNQAIINNLVQDSSTTYWSTFGTASGAGNFNPDGSVMAKSSSATAPTTLSSVSSLGQLGNLAIGGGSVFFPAHTISGVQPDYTQGSLMTVPGWKTTGFTPAVPTTLLPTLQGIDFVTVDSKATNVFWASLKNHSPAVVAEALVCGGANSAWISQYYQPVLDSISASASFSGGTIYVSPLNSPAITPVATQQSPVSLAMRADGNVYWLDDPQNTLPTIAENAGSLKLGWLTTGGTWAFQIEVPGLNRPQNLVVDSKDNVYWSEAPHLDGSPGTIKMRPNSVAGRPIVTLATTGSANTISGLAVGGRYLYWTDDVNGGEVRKVAIPWDWMITLPPRGIATGRGHSCVVKDDNTIWCWGWNRHGELGNGLQDPDPCPPGAPLCNIPSATHRPTQVIELPSSATNKVVSLSAGAYETCAALQDGHVWCWGVVPDTVHPITYGTKPMQIPAVFNALQVSAGYLVDCALINGGTIQCWGNNLNHQLGDGSGTDTFASPSIPVQVSGITNAVALRSGLYTFCALLGTGDVKCWGSNFHGQLGDGTTTDSSTPVSVLNVAGVKDITVGVYHACALLGAGGVNCWGDNYFGELGDGTTKTERHSAVPVVGLSNNVVQVAAGDSVTCATLTDGTATCWGENASCALGNGDTNSSDSQSIAGTPVTYLKNGMKTSDSSSLRYISGGGCYCAALTNAVECWGADDLGQLGDGASGPNRCVATTVYFP